MLPHYKDWDYKGSAPLANIASKLFAVRGKVCRLSPYVHMTDPERVPDSISAAQNLPQGACIIYRHFGTENRKGIAQKLRQVTFAKGQQFLIGDDPELAISCGADGVHFRRDAALAKPTTWRRRCPDWVITMAGLKGAQTYSGDVSVLDGLFISSIFQSRSPSAGAPIGPANLSQICAQLPVSIIALGGINAKTAPKLIGTGIYGIAGIDGFT